MKSDDDDGEGGDANIASGGGGDDDEAKKAQATVTDLDKEGDIADARQVVNKEKTKAASTKKTQATSAQRGGLIRP